MNSLKLESKIDIGSIFKRFEQPIGVESENDAEGECSEEKTRAVQGPADFKIRCLLGRANEMLKESRNMLMYSYVFAFYLGPGNMATCFKLTQAYLQSNVERLSQFLERDVHKLSDPEKCWDVEHVISFCHQCSRNMLQTVRDGMRENTWSFRDV